MREKTKIVVTDSGLGGLSVAARLFNMLKKERVFPTPELIFVNALPETNRGYNTMPDTKLKINTFNRVLEGIEHYFKPSIIAIACNTLSAIADGTKYYRDYQNKIINIIEIAVEMLLRSIYDIREANLIILGTETTILSGVYQNHFIKAGIDKKQLIPTICSGLASAIELDSKSENTKLIIERCISDAFERIVNKQNKSYVLLACTHYGYTANQIYDSFKDKGLTDFELIDLNDYLVAELFERTKTDRELSSSSKVVSDNEPSIKVFSRCRILPGEIDSIAGLLRYISPETVSALKNYTFKKDLF